MKYNKIELNKKYYFFGCIINITLHKSFIFSTSLKLLIHFLSEGHTFVSYYLLFSFHFNFRKMARVFLPIIFFFRRNNELCK